MAEELIIMWPGASGKEYKYWIYPIGTAFKAVPGNYIFAKQTKPNTWTPVYVGETDNLDERLANHEKMPCVKRNGGTHVHAHACSDSVPIRQAEEADIMEKFKPTCNLEV